MSKNDNELGKEVLYWLAETLSGGWIRPSLLERVFTALRIRSSPVKFLNLSPEQLRKRYIEEPLVGLPIEQEYFELPQAWVFDNTERRLPLDAFELIVDETNPEYKIPQLIGSKASALLAHQKKLQKRHLYDSTTIRLNGIQESDGRVCLLVSKAHYFDYLATNFSIDARLPGWDKSLRDTVHPNRRLCRLDESLLANHLGIGVLAFTADGFLILPVRSKAGVNIRRGEIGPSISGATNFDRDINSSLSDLITPCLREGAEELGIETSNFSMPNTTLLGITRELLRGGKPEMFFATTLTITAEELREKFKRAEHQYETSRIEWAEFSSLLHGKSANKERALLEDFGRCLEKYRKQMSIPMLTNLVLWVKYRLAAA